MFLGVPPSLYKHAVPHFYMKMVRDTDSDDFNTPIDLVNACLDQLNHYLPHKDVQLSWLDTCAGDDLRWITEIKKNNFGDKCDYTEIKDGLDFFHCRDKYDVIVGNPPFSQLNAWLAHSVALSQRIVAYILPAHSLNHKRLAFMESFGFELVGMHSFPNPKEWGIGFSHFFCVWKKHYTPEGKAWKDWENKNNKILQQEISFQYLLTDFVSQGDE